MLAVGMLFLAGMFALQAAGCGSLVDRSIPQPPEAYAQVFLNATALAFLVLGVLIINYRPENRIGWLCLVTGLSIFALVFPLEYATCGMSGVRLLPGWPVMAWLANMTVMAPLFLIFVILPLWFPDGQFLSPSWRSFALVTLAILAGMLLFSSFWPAPLTFLEAVDAGELSEPIRAGF